MTWQLYYGLCVLGTLYDYAITTLQMVARDLQETEPQFYKVLRLLDEEKITSSACTFMLHVSAM